MGALTNSSNRLKGALIGAGIGTGLGAMDASSFLSIMGNSKLHYFINPAIGAGMGYGMSHLANSPNRLIDTLMGAGVGLSNAFSSDPKMHGANTYVRDNNISNALTGGILGGYLNSENRLKGSLIGAGSMLGTGIGANLLGGIPLKEALGFK